MAGRHINSVSTDSFRYLAMANLWAFCLRLQVKAPWIKTFFYAEDDAYVIPGVDHVTLGGCRLFGSNRLELDEHMSKAIWDRCTRLVPSLKRAEVSYRISPRSIHTKSHSSCRSALVYRIAGPQAARARMNGRPRHGTPVPVVHPAVQV